MQRELILSLLGKPKFTYKIKHFFGFTKNIIEQILQDFELYKNQTQKIAYLFRKNDVLETCKAIFDFCRANIQYIEDKDGVQDIISPKALIYRGFGDCKSFSILVGSILYNLQIPFCFRFVSFGSQDVTHVYIYCQGIKIDCTLPKFDLELPYLFNQDICMNTSRIASVNGAKVGLGPWTDFSNTTQTNTGFNWNALANSILQILPNVINPNNPQNLNNPANAQALAQAISQNQAILNQLQNAQNQNQGFNLNALLQNPIVLAVGAFFIYQLFMAKK
jgi:hypothetical protein